MNRHWLLAATILTTGVMLAQDAPPEADPPSRAARLGLIAGTVSFQPGGVEDWVPATLNRPLTTGDRLWTEADSRAELTVGSTIFRVNGRTNFTFINLSDTLAQVQISSGTVNVRVRRLDEQEGVEIDTPQAAFSLLRPGDYRIDVNEQGDATIATVRGGEVEATGGGQAFPIRAREQVRVTGAEGAPPALDRRDAPVADAFDNFCQGRDRRDDMSESARHVSRDMPGYSDLDQNGAWRETPDYGWVWAPRVASGWAPYHDGHWAWIEPWGWTWVDDAPWGYAPFHYGRWASAGGVWVWVPGPPAVRPVYAPALVAWVGGPSFGIGIAVGPAVGWFPLGPREVWVPPYRYSPRYITQVNVTNTVIVNRTVITNVNVANVTYMNRSVPGAFTAVPRSAMVGGRPVAGAAVVLPRDTVVRGQVTNYAAVAPERAAVLGGRAPGRFAPPAAVENRRAVVRVAPPAPPVSFTQRQGALQANPGRPIDRGIVNQTQQNQPRPAPTFRQSIPQEAPRPQTPAPAAGFGRTAPAVANPPAAAPQPNVRQQQQIERPQQQVERPQPQIERRQPAPQVNRPQSTATPAPTPAPTAAPAVQTPQGNRGVENREVRKEQKQAQKQERKGDKREKKEDEKR